MLRKTRCERQNRTMLRRLAARAARRRRRRRASTADVFVSRHTAVPREDVDAYVKTRVLPAGGPSQAARVDGSGANLLLKECPSAGFCSPTKYAGTGKPGNDYKFAILRDGGAYFCHRCGGKGSWYDLRLGMSGAVPSSLEGESSPRRACVRVIHQGRTRRSPRGVPSLSSTRKGVR